MLATRSSGLSIDAGHGLVSRLYSLFHDGRLVLLVDALAPMFEFFHLETGRILYRRRLSHLLHVHGHLVYSGRIARHLLFTARLAQLECPGLLLLLCGLRVRLGGQGEFVS